MPLGCRLLLVEDDQELLAVFARQFSRRGFQVTPVFHPRQALEAVRARHYDAAVVDYSLPEMDGAALMAKLRTQIKDLPVILLAGREAPRLRAQSGASACLLKPCRAASLVAALEEALEDRLAEEGAEAGSARSSTHAVR